MTGVLFYAIVLRETDQVLCSDETGHAMVYDNERIAALVHAFMPMPTQKNIKSAADLSRYEGG